MAHGNGIPDPVDYAERTLSEIPFGVPAPAGPPLGVGKYFSAATASYGPTLTV